MNYLTKTDLVVVIGGSRGGQRGVGSHPLVLPDDGGAAANVGHGGDLGPGPVVPGVRPLPAPHGRRGGGRSGLDEGEGDLLLLFGFFGRFDAKSFAQMPDSQAQKAKWRTLDPLVDNVTHVKSL